MKHAAEFEFAYLQLHSHYSPFGGLAAPLELAEQLASFDRPIAAALTDTFSLAATPEWGHLLKEAGLRPLVGAEVGISWDNGGRSLPASLILLVESSAGYRNLCRIISAGLANAGPNPLTAYVDTDTLARHRDGLIAIAPYYGGPVTAALKQKASEARSRAQSLRDIFGPDNFFLGAPPPAGQPAPNTAEGQQDGRLSATIKLNSGLVKLGRDLKIGLVGTGEARYVTESEAGAYGALRNRLNRVLGEQFSPAMLQQPQDWLYAIRPDRPTADLQLYAPEVLINHYNNKDWPEALANNRAIAARCARWHFEEHQPLVELRKRCESELARRYAENGPEEEQARNWLESELADVEELGLAGPLLAATRAIEAARQARQIAIARRLSGSFVAYLLGLSERPPEIVEGDTFRFKFEEGSRPLRLEVGRRGRTRLMASLNSGALDEAEFKALPVASPTSEVGGLALLHPRQIALAIGKAPLGEVTPVQPALESSGGTELQMAAQLGRAVTPSGVYKLEVSEAAGVARLQLALDIYNHWRIEQGVAPLEPEEMGQPVEGNSPSEDQEAGEYERRLVQFRLGWFKQHAPAAYYAAALSLAEPSKRAGLVEAARQAHLKVLPPTTQSRHPYFTLEDENSLRAGLVALVSWDKAEDIAALQPKNLEELVKGCPLSKEEWLKLAWSGALDGFASREAIAEAASQLAEAGKEWQEWQSQQTEITTGESEENSNSREPLTLFDLFDSAEGTEVPARLPEPKPVELPEVKSLSALQRLRQQASVLGFYTSEHPLWGQLAEDDGEENLSRPLTLGEVLAKAGADNGAGKPLTLAGIVAGLRRLPFTESDGRGQELTVAWLEDWTGRLELLIPPKLTTNLELVEGLALTALARWLKAEERPVLVAEALDGYPPSGQLIVSEEEVALDNLAARDEPPLNGLSGPPGEDDGWASSLFTEFQAANPSSGSAGAPATNGSAGQNQGAGAASNRGRNGGGKKSPATRPMVRHVYINLHLTGDEQADNDFMNQVKQVLRQYPGEEVLHIYLHWPDGGPPDHLEPQSLQVTYSPEFAAEIKAMLGGQPDAVYTEERPG